MRTSVDFGIDLGTTNSAVAVLEGAGVKVFKNNEGSEITPSAVWIDKKGSMYVGRQAKERTDSDPANTASEFKILMGTSEEKALERAGRGMKPEELSAEVLKSLKADVLQQTGEDIRAAVITVPAAFELNQCEATNAAARLAGFEFTPLLQEPTAAALAYGFQDEGDKAFWLIYDLGGGTFDAAVVQMREGEFSVVNHGGDNFLGGKLIDWEIVEQLLIPAVTGEHALAGFGRGNPKWISAVAKLKLAAEAAKIRCSRDESAEIFIEFLCQDDDGKPVEFSYELTRRDVARLAEPFVLRSLNICKKTFSDKRLGAGDIQKMVLVGGPTLGPYLRDLLADPNAGLGIPIEFGIDPLTVVAQGAAIFAGTQRVEGLAAPAPAPAGAFSIDFEYKPVGPDIEPLVGGKVSAPDGGAVEGFSVEFVNEQSKPPWRSGKLPLPASGVFTTTLWAEKGRQNEFVVELTDPTGKRCDAVPASIPYTVGVVHTSPPLTHSIGVALANGETEWLMEKGTALPARRRCVLRTAAEVRQGQTGDVIRIPVLEGEHPRADRNRRIGMLEVTAEQVSRGVPAGSEVEVTVEIDRSRLVLAKAYVPVLDEEYENPIDLGTESSPDPVTLRDEVRRELDRLDQARKNADDTGDERARAVLQRIDSEQMVQEIERSLNAADVDPEAAIKTDRRLLDLKVAVDEIEASLEWPALVREAEGLIPNARDLVSEHGEGEDLRALDAHEAAIREAIASGDPALLSRRVDELRGLVIRVLDRKGIMQAAWFQQLQEQRSQMTDPGQADQLISRGHWALQENDVEGLRTVNRQLAALLPTPPPEPDVSTVLR